MSIVNTAPGVSGRGGGQSSVATYLLQALDRTVHRRWLQGSSVVCLLRQPAHSAPASCNQAHRAQSAQIHTWRECGRAVAALKVHPSAVPAVTA